MNCANSKVFFKIYPDLEFEIRPATDRKAHCIFLQSSTLSLH